MGAGGGGGSRLPVGALGAGFGSRIACGRGGGGVLVTCRLGSGGGGGGGGGSLGLGGSTNSLRISTGITTSTARRSSPLCSAQRAATCNSTTLPAMTTFRESPRAEGGAEKRSDTIIHWSASAFGGARCSRTATKLLAKDPPDRAGDKDQTAAEGREEFHALLSLMELASWIAAGPVSRWSAAIGCEALHWATTSRAQPSHWPHWVATPSSNWTSSNVMPARTWRAISRSETRRQTQTIMACKRLAVLKRS